MLETCEETRHVFRTWFFFAFRLQISIRRSLPDASARIPEKGRLGVAYKRKVPQVLQVLAMHLVPATLNHLPYNGSEGILGLTFLQTSPATMNLVSAAGAD